MYAQLEKWSLNDRALHVTKYVINDLDDSLLYTPVPKRPAFDHNDKSVTMPVIYVTIDGVKGDLEDFRGFIYNIDEKLSGFGSLYFKVETPLSKKFDPELLKMLQAAWLPFQREQDAASEALIDSFINAGALKTPADLNMKSLIRSALIKTVDFYRKQSDYRFFEVKNILFHLIHWYNTYCGTIIDDFDYTRNNPSVLFWGQIAKREIFFTIFLYNLGCDVICINGIKDPVIEKLKENEDFISSFTFPRQMELGDFPTERPAVKMDTVAKQHSDELRETLHSDDSFCYKPWQFIDYSVRPLTMRTTIDEIYILGMEKAMIRQGFEVQSKRVSIPHFFAKINGINQNQNDYWKTYNKLRSFPKTQIIEKLPIVSKKLKLMKNEYFMVLNSEKTIDPEKLMRAAFWPYLQYRTHIQKLIADKCASLCSLEDFKRVVGVPPEMQKIEIFSRMMQLPAEILQLIQTFDYPSDVPKLIVFNNGDGPILSQDDAIVIAFAASAAIDVILFNPAGQNDIEIYLKESEIDIHNLEDVAFKINPKTRSIMGKFF